MCYTVGGERQCYVKPPADLSKRKDRVMKYTKEAKRIDEIITILTNDDSEFLDMFEEVVILIKKREGWK